MRRTDKKATTRSPVEIRGTCLLRLADKVPRFKHSRLGGALIEAIKTGDSELALWLLSQGSNPQAADIKGRSALWWAATWCRSSVIRELVKRGAALPDDVLMGPVVKGEVKIVRFLVQHGANVNCVANSYSPVPQQNIKRVLLTAALGTAAINPKVESIPIMLIRAGAKVNRGMLPKSLRGLENRSMLGITASDGLLRTVKAMIAAGADVNIRDDRGRTPLFDAVEGGHVAVTRELLRAGARADVTDHDGTTLVDAVHRKEQSFQMVLAGAMGRETQLKSQAAAWDRRRTRMIALLERNSRDRKSK